MHNNMSKSIVGYVCVVTGATRGIGKGIALQLAENGAKVYITGRTLDTPKGSKIAGSLRETVSEIEERGGLCIPVQCDHSNDSDIEKLFEMVKRENDGQLDVLVNNAYSGVATLMANMGVPFWKQPLSVWDDINDVGLRNHYQCSVYAAQMMVPRKRGLIVNISSAGGMYYLYNTAYGIGKAACDRMAADCGLELQKHNVAFISLWPGFVGTETLLTKLQELEQLPEGSVPSAASDIPGSEASRIIKDTKNKLDYFGNGESPEFVGKCVVGLAMDRDCMKKSGKAVMTCDLGREYGLKDKAGYGCKDMRQVNHILGMYGYKRTAWYIPNFVKIPKFVLTLTGHKLY